MRLPPEFISELKMRNDIESVIAPYVTLKKKGSNLVGLCPFHNEKTGSFTVWPNNGSFYCFGCGAGGDVITFLMQAEHLDYMEAVQLLAERSGMMMPVGEYDDKTAKLKARIYEANRAAARFFYENLIAPNGKQALNYLTGRGLLPKTIKQFGLGFAPDEWDALVKHLRANGFSEEVIVAADLAVRTKAGNLIDRFRKRVMFPVIDLRGNFVAFSGRKLQAEDYGGKYINTGDTPVYKKSAFMFGLNFAKNHCAKQAVLVEGNMDTVSLHQAGFPMAVAPLGTAFTAEQARLLARYTEEVVVTLDADTAGGKATEKVLRILEDAGVKARVLRLPECKDPDEYIKKNGAARFAALLDGSVSDIEYKLHIAGEGLDLSLSDDKLEYLRRAAEVLAGEPDEIARDLYAGRLSDLCEVSKETILKRVGDLSAKRQKAARKKELNEIVQPKISRDAVNPEKALYPRGVAAEEMLIALLMAHPDLFETVSAEIREDEFLSEFSKRVYRAVSELLAERRTVDLSALGGEFSPKEMGYLAMLEHTTVAATDPARVAQESIAVIKTEAARKNAKPVSELSDEEWAEQMKRLADEKRKQ